MKYAGLFKVAVVIAAFLACTQAHCLRQPCQSYQISQPCESCQQPLQLLPQYDSYTSSDPSYGCGCARPRHQPPCGQLVEVIKTKKFLTHRPSCEVCKAPVCCCLPKPRLCSCPLPKPCRCELPKPCCCQQPCSC